MRCNCPLTLIYPERARCLQGDGSPRPVPHVHCLPSNTTQREKDRNGNVEMLTLLSLSLLSLSYLTFSPLMRDGRLYISRISLPLLLFLLTHPPFSFSLTLHTLFIPLYPFSRFFFQPHPHLPLSRSLTRHAPRFAHPSHSVLQEAVRVMTLLLPLSRFTLAETFPRHPSSFQSRKPSACICGVHLSKLSADFPLRND